jgi:aryl-alcohol dehydrogenase-like predicted oxidoreductase
METRQLGKNGPRLTTIGFGCWAIGGAGWQGSWGPQDDAASVDAIHAALDRGINWFDTAAVYGLGHSEEVLGRALGSRRADVLVATKCGVTWDVRGTLTNNGHYDSILREAEASLRRLGTDHIDLYQLHWPDFHNHAPIEETMRAMQTLVQSGKVRYVGVSNFDKPLLERAVTSGHVDSLQPRYNLLHREPEAALLPFCRQEGIGVVAYSPLASGLLGGRYTMDTRFAEGDWRGGDPDFTGDGLRRNLAIVDGLRAIAARHGRTVPQLAIAWVLANPSITAAIVGVRKTDHITSILPAADWPLDMDTLAEIESVVSPRAVETIGR